MILVQKKKEMNTLKVMKMTEKYIRPDTLKFYVTDPGDESVGIPSYQTPLMDTDVCAIDIDEEEREGFRKDITEAFKWLCDSPNVVLSTDEKLE